MKNIISILTFVICFVSCTDGNDWEGRIPVSAEFYNENQQTEGEHEYVDLGLPSGTLWATIDIGATSPTGRGLLFAWGDTEGYKKGEHTFELNNYKFTKLLSQYEYEFTKYICDSEYGRRDNLSRLQDRDDAAYVLWGHDWCMPTKTQYEELLTNCTANPTEINGVAMYELIGKNGNSIYIRQDCAMWSSDMFTSGWQNTICAYAFYISYNHRTNIREIEIVHQRRDDGHTIRPVRK